MHNHYQKAKRKLASCLKKHPHTEEHIVYIFSLVLISMLLHAVIQL